MMVGSLFSGYGGLEMGINSVLNGEVAWVADNDTAPAAILNHHYPNVPNLGDVTTVDWGKLEPVDLLCGGYPCQPFSHAGTRAGTNDPRHLWPWFADAIGVLRPRYVFLENVTGHLGLGMVDVLGDLTALGYDARWCVVRASDAGACHQRARVFILAYPDRVAGAAPRERASRDDPHLGPEPEHRTDRRPGAPSDAKGATRQERRPEGAGARWGPLPGRADSHDPADAPREPGREGQGPGQGRASGVSGAPGRSPDVSADSRRERHGGGQDAGMVGRLGCEADGSRRQASAARALPRDRSHTDAPDAQGPERAGTESGDLGAAPGPAAEPGERPGTDWGQYGPAIRRWEAVTGRPSPRPTDPGRNGEPRLSPIFVEWMMGLPEGWVTDPAIGLTRAQQLRALGNGVVPAQAALALTLLLNGAAS